MHIYAGPRGAAFPDDDKSLITVTPSGEQPAIQSVKDALCEIFFKSASDLNYTAIGQHIPLKEASGNPLVNTSVYKTSVGLTQPERAQTFCPVGSVTPPAATDMPVLSLEAYVREGMGTCLMLPPLCTMEFTGKDMKEEIVKLARAHRESVRYSHQLQEIRWLIGHSRYNITCVGQPVGGGKARLVSDPAVVQNGAFSEAPSHWGSPQWIEQMLLHTGISPKRDLVIELPEAIWHKYRRHLEENVTGQPAVEETWESVRDCRFTLLSRMSGRKITFVKAAHPVYVEVNETEWSFQPMLISQSLNSPMANPDYGKASAALITVSDEAFHKEPETAVSEGVMQCGLKGNEKISPDMVREQMSTVSVEAFTGEECEEYVLKPWKTAMQEKGFPMENFSNHYKTWLGLLLTVKAVYVEDNPRQCANFLLKMPEA